MAIATRSSSASPVKKSSTTTKSEDTPTTEEPLKHFILPKAISNKARFILLPHPRDSSIQRFLFCPEKGLYHFSKIRSPSSDPRSLLLAPSGEENEDNKSRSQDMASGEAITSTGRVSKSSDFFVATPFDTSFLLLPLVMSPKTVSGKKLFQPLDDLLEDHIREDKALKYLYENGRTRVEEALSRFCDTLEAGDEQMFRPNEEKTLQMILSRVDSVISQGLPPSLEDKFVIRALEAPVLSVKREETTISTVKTKSMAPDEEGEKDASDAFESQSTTASTTVSAVFSEVSTTSSTSTVVTETISPELLQLQKQRTVLDFILASYVPDSIADRLRARLGSQDSPINFTPLEDHLKSLAALRVEALSARSISDFSRKRGLEDDEAMELRAEKKRKQEEDEKKKKLGESRGVRDLKKVNVSGMKKMSDFFAKKPATKAG